ncbi:hypothetical protein D6C99_08306, partial [Aureobasidium pullulans]
QQLSQDEIPHKCIGSASRFDNFHVCGSRSAFRVGNGAGVLPKVYRSETIIANIVPSQLGCLAKLIPQSPCTLTDVECLCTNVPLNSNLTVCVLESCTTYEGLMTKNVSSKMCGAPVRNQTLKPLLVGVIGGGLALLVFILRMCAGLPVGGRPLGWDDYTICIAVALGTPPTVFSVLLSKNGLGKDMWTLPLPNIENVLFYYYLGEIFYFASLTATKISILAFFL